jgi:hypothetical protein
MLIIVGMCLFCIAPLPAQNRPCVYDAERPTLEHARVSFRSLDYLCAERELQDLLRQPDLGLKAKADAHVLMAAVYYVMLDDERERRSKALEQFRAAFREYRDWKGDLDISSTEFFDLMQEARRDVDIERGGGQSSGSIPVHVSKETASPTYAWVGSGLLAVSAGIFIYGTALANDRWDKYESDPDHPQDLYDSYKSANNLRNISGIATIVTGVAAGYLWLKYLSSDTPASPYSTHVESGAENMLYVYPSANGIELIFCF